MPVFFVLLVGLVIYGAIEGDIGDAAAFLFTEDWSKLTPQVMNSALGHGAVLALARRGRADHCWSPISQWQRARPDGRAHRNRRYLVALLAGLMIFPIVFAVGLDPAAGPTLVFQTLPFAFQTMPGGATVRPAVLPADPRRRGHQFDFAARSADRLRDRRARLDPAQVGPIFGGGAFLIGIACLLGYNVWSDVRPLGFWSCSRIPISSTRSIRVH